MVNNIENIDGGGVSSNVPEGEYPEFAGEVGAAVAPEVVAEEARAVTMEAPAVRTISAEDLGRGEMSEEETARLKRRADALVKDIFAGSNNFFNARGKHGAMEVEMARAKVEAVQQKLAAARDGVPPGEYLEMAHRAYDEVAGLRGKPTMAEEIKEHEERAAETAARLQEQAAEEGLRREDEARREGRPDLKIVVRDAEATRGAGEAGGEETDEALVELMRRVENLKKDAGGMEKAGNYDGVLAVQDEIMELLKEAVERRANSEKVKKIRDMWRAIGSLERDIRLVA
jgi:hypothetical protein